MPMKHDASALRERETTERALEARLALVTGLAPLKGLTPSLGKSFEIALAILNEAAGAYVTAHKSVSVDDQE